MNWSIWTRAALIRCIKTICQAAIAGIGTAAVISEIDWKYIVSASIVAGILSLLTSLAGLPEVEAQNVAQRVAIDRSDDAPIQEEE